MSDNRDSRQFCLTINFYLLSSILIAVCHLTQAEDTFATVRLFGCTNLKPRISCPFGDKPACDNYCTVVGFYVERLSEGDRKCPYADPPLYCPTTDAVQCLKYCNSVSSYQPVLIFFEHLTEFIVNYGKNVRLENQAQHLSDLLAWDSRFNRLFT